jgi:hypothetical protein
METPYGLCLSNRRSLPFSAIPFFIANYCQKNRARRYPTFRIVVEINNQVDMIKQGKLMYQSKHLPAICGLIILITVFEIIRKVTQKGHFAGFDAFSVLYHIYLCSAAV